MAAIPNVGGRDISAISYPALLRQADYKTGFVGKYGVGGNGAPRDAFDVSFGDPGPERVGQSRELGRQAIQFLDGVKSNESFCGGKGCAGRKSLHGLGSTRALSPHNSNRR